MSQGRKSLIQEALLELRALRLDMTEVRNSINRIAPAQHVNRRNPSTSTVQSIGQPPSSPTFTRYLQSTSR